MEPRFHGAHRRELHVRDLLQGQPSLRVQDQRIAVILRQLLQRILLDSERNFQISNPFQKNLNGRTENNY